MRKSRFEILGERENEELLLGLAGKFWTIRGEMQKINSGNFREFDEKGFAKAVWNFSVDGDGNETRLTTETRVRCLDDASRKSFGVLLDVYSAVQRFDQTRNVANR